MTGQSEVETIRGAIPTSDLGVTLMHEHVFVLSPEIMANHPEGWGDEQARDEGDAGGGQPLAPAQKAADHCRGWCARL